MKNGSPKREDDTGPALLVSYVYLPLFLKYREGWTYRAWMLDSGAFSAFNSGTPIDLSAYIETCQTLLESDPKLSTIFALDVIGDWRGSSANFEAMRAAGIPAVPCWHDGEPAELLRDYAQASDRVALGGVARKAHGYKVPWANRAFSLLASFDQWPKKVHGFGFGDIKALMTVPFHSADATSWSLRSGFGQFLTYSPTMRPHVRGVPIYREAKNQVMRAEVVAWQRRETEMKSYWRKVWNGEGPTLALAVSSNREADYKPRGAYWWAFDQAAIGANCDDSRDS